MEKVDIGVADIGLRREHSCTNPLIRSLCARTKSQFLHSIKNQENDNIVFGLRGEMCKHGPTYPNALRQDKK